MSESVSIQCPHCGDAFEVAVDAGEGSAEFVVDCEVCCRPMTVTVRVRAGEIEELQVAAC